MSPDSGVSILHLVLLLLAIGGAGGFLSGLLGVGGGILFVPALFFAMTALGFDTQYAMHLAVATSLLIVLATGATSAVAHYRRGSVDMARVRAWGPYIFAGVVAGALFASSVDGAVLKRVFAGITLLISFYMAFGRERTSGESVAFLTLKVQRVLCVGIGMVSSMIGVGGAILTVPMMSYSGMTMQKAVGTGAALGVVISLPGTLGYMAGGLIHNIAGLPPYSIGYVNFIAAGMIVPTAMLLAPVGVKISHAMPRLMLRRVFAAVLVIVSIRMFMSF
jgi:uncharacterized membrane protein YfcA